MKRRIISALAGIFALAVFTGCQQPAQTSDSGSGTKDSDTEVKETNVFKGTSWKYTDEYGSVTWILSFTSETEGTLTTKLQNGVNNTVDFNYSVVTPNKAEIVYKYGGGYGWDAEIVGSNLKATITGRERVFTKQY